MRALKIKDILNEELLGTIDYSLSADALEIYKNPRSIKRMDDDIKAISSEDGDLFVVNGRDIVHDEIIRWLRQQNLVSPLARFNGKKDMFDKVVAWTRYDNTNTFALSESYEDVNGLSKEDKQYIKTIAKRTKEKNPQYDFVTTMDILDYADK